MKRIAIFLAGFFLKVPQAAALITISVSGNTNTVPALATSYVSFSSAITALNSVTVINGPVTFNMNSGTTESVTAQVTLTQPGSSIHLISFVKSGTGANPKLTRTDAGTNATSGSGGFGDGVFRIDGTDNISFSNLDIAASNQGIEYGYYVHKPSATNGSQNLTIKNATVTMTKGTSAYVTGIYIDNGQTALTLNDGLTITANSGRSMNITLTGNTIQNVHRGIYCYGYFGYYTVPNYMDQDINIGLPGTGNGNIIINFGGGTASEASGIFCRYIANAHVDNNTVNNVSGGVVATSTLYGIYLSYSMGVCTLNNNTITLNNTTGEADWITLYSFGYSNSFPVRQVQIHNNSFAGAVGTASFSSIIGVSITASNVNLSVRNNTTVGNITKGGVGGNFYGYYNSTNSNMMEHVVGNNFSNLSSGGSCYGIYSNCGASDTTYIDSNTVANLSSTGTNYNCIGIQMTDATLGFVRNNTISNVSGIFARGIGLNYSNYPGDVQILRNKIYNLSSIASNTNNDVVTGIYLYNYSEPGQVRIYNNLIGNLNAPTSAATNAIDGIHLSCSYMTSLYSGDIAHNTIYINASSVGANFGSSGIMEYVYNSGSNFDRLLLRNNIIVNTSTPTGTGVVTAFRRNGLQTNTYDPTSNHNLFYAGIPSSTNLIFTNGTQNFSTLGAYQSYLLSNVPAAERNSISENPVFLSTTGSSSDFLKVDSNNPSGIESGGAVLTGVQSDFTGTIRAGQSGYAGTGYAPDLGAWELNGTPLSVCGGTPSQPTAIISNINPCADSVFAVYLSPLYPAGTTYQWQQSTTDSVSGFINVAGANESYLPISTAIDTWYRCVVTCGLSGLSVTSNAVQVDLLPMSGTYVISNTGSGQFTNFASAFAALHCRNTSGPVTFEVVDGQVFTETSNLQLRYEGAWPVTFRKQGAGSNPVIKRVGTSSTSNYILELSGADKITFDGIDFEQTGTASATWVEWGLHITNSSATDGASYNTFKNGTITMSNANANSIAVYCHSTAPLPATAAGTNSHNRFVNMTILSSFVGYKFDNTSTVVQDDSNAVVGEGGQRGSIQTLGNGTVTGTIYGIYASEQKNFLVDSVDVIGMQAASFSYGIYSNSSDSAMQVFSNNNIQFNTSSSSIRGMALFNLFKVKAYNNEIHELYSTNTSTGTTQGLAVTCSDTSWLYNNKIYNLSSAATSTGNAVGMYIGGDGVQRIYNNMISDIRAGAATYFPASVAGIDFEWGNGLIQCYNNSIYLTDIGTSTSYRSAGIFSNDTTLTLDLRNNVVVNLSNVSTGSYAVGLIKYYHTPDKIAATSNNNLWYAGVPDAKHFIYYSLTPSNTAQTLAQYKALSTISPAESDAVSEAVNILPSLSGEIRPNPVTPTLIEGRGQPIAWISTDFEQDNRNALNPDLGADESSFTPILNADCPALLSPANALSGICPFETVTLNWGLPVSGRTPVSYDVYLGTTPNPPFKTNTTGFSYVVPSMLGNTTYYWKVVAKFATGDANGCDIRSFSTTNTGITSLVPGQRCGPGQVTLSVNGGGTIQWYSTPSAATPFTTGPSYSPTLAATTTYYVSSLNGYNLGWGYAGKPSLGTSSSAGTSATEYLTFSALGSAMIDSVVVYPSAAGNVVLQLTNNTGTVLYTATKAVTSGQVGAAVSMAVNWPVTAGNTYRIYKPATSVNLLRNTTGAVYPYTLPGLISVTSSSGGAAYYSWAYNWTVRAACESPRQAITATINAVSSSSGSVTACNSYTWPVNAQTYTSSGVYTATSVPASGCVHTDSLLLTIGVSGSNPSSSVTACSTYNWPVNGQTYTTSGTYTANFSTVNGCDSSFQLYLTIQNCTSTLNVKLYLEGYYSAGGLMNPALMNQGIGFDTSLVDFITIEAHHATSLALSASANVLLQRNGLATANLPITPGLYYIVIKHRNTVETWSATPQPLGASPLFYDFTTASGKAYGGNMQQVEPGVWACFTGDLNSDANVDMIDIAAYEQDVNNAIYGYYATDINGDGNVDLLDGPVLENNLTNFVYSIHP